MVVAFIVWEWTMAANFCLEYLYCVIFKTLSLLSVIYQLNID